MLGLGLSLQKGVSAFNAGRALVSSYIRRVTEAGGVLQNTACDAAAINELNQDRLLEPASWVLVPDGIKEDVVYAQKPSTGLGDLTFTRASDATYTDASGVVRRSPYNLFTNSEDFDTWTKQQINVSTNVAANPLTSVVNADLLIPDTTSNNHRIFKLATVPSSSVQSVYLKAAGYNYVSLGKAGGISGSTIIFNLSNGTVSGSASGFSGTISPAGNGWYLCSLISSGATNDYASFSNWIVIRDNSTNLVFTGDGTSGVLVANAQLVEGNEALPYFPTTNRQDVPRIDFRNADGTLSTCGRLLLEPQRTNSIRNSSMVGAVAGTPGTLPTNWLSVNGGLTRTVVGIGTENGLPYIDVRFNGTTTGTSVDVGFEGTSIIAAATGQTWTHSLYFKTITSQPNSFQIHQFEYNSVGGFVTQANQSFSPTATLQRFTWSRAMTGATTAFVYPFIRMNVTNGTAYDFTIRIAAPQMELGAYATTWVPTTTAAVTRLADTASKTGVSSLIGQTEGTLFIETSFVNPLTGGVLIALGEVSNRVVMFVTSSGNLNLGVSNSNVPTDVFVIPNFLSSTGGRAKIAFAYKAGDYAYCINGGAVVTSVNSISVPLNKTIISLGSVAGSLLPVAENVSQAALFPTRLSNDQLEVLTSEGYGNYALLAQSLNCVLQ